MATAPLNIYGKNAEQGNLPVNDAPVVDAPILDAPVVNANEETGAAAPTLNTSFLNEEGAPEAPEGAKAPPTTYNSGPNVEVARENNSATAPRMYQSNSNVEKAPRRRKSRATPKHLERLPTDLESPPQYPNNSGASSPRRVNYPRHHKYRNMSHKHRNMSHKHKNHFNLGRNNEVYIDRNRSYVGGKKRKSRKTKKSRKSRKSRKCSW